MRARSLFTRPPMGPMLGSPMPLRRRSLGFTPTGAAMPTACTDLGTRMIVEQGGFSPINCPTAPDCFDIIDAVTGTVIVAKVKGSSTWIQPCGQWGYPNPGGSTTPPAGGGDRLKACDLPGHPGWYLLRHDSGPSAGGLVSSSPLSKAEVENIAGTTPLAWTTECPINPDERIWILCNTSPTTMAFVDVITGEKRLEQAGQAPSPHPLCPAPSQQSSPAATSSCPEMTYAEWQAADKAEQAAWQASGGTTVRGGCAIVKMPDGRKERLQSCYWPGMPGGGGSTGGGGGSEEPSGENIVGTPGAPYNAQTSDNGMSSCDEKWKWTCENIGGPNDPWKTYCPGKQGAAAPVPAPSPAPASTPAPAATAPAPAATAPQPGAAPSGGTVPLSIDIQAFTPGGTGPVPAQPLMQPQPLLPPRPVQPAPQPAAQPIAQDETKLVSVAPKEPESKPLDVGSMAGIGLVALIAIAAAAFTRK